MTGRRDDEMHQPPNPADLQRVPPGSPDCARVRGLLRDYSDGDLVDADARLVDEHLQTCRVCAVELARAEHEVMRLRRAVLPLKLSSQVPEGFARRVVDRLVLEGGDVQAGGGESTSDASRAGRGTASRSVSKGGSSSVSSSSVSSALGSPAGMLVACLFLLFLLGVGVRVFAGDDPAPQRVAMLFVENANDAFDEFSQPLGKGASVGDDEAIWIKRGGKASLNWHDPTRRSQPAATIELQGGELKMKGGAPLLVDGKVRIETNRGVEVPLNDGTSVMLGVGDYVITAEIPFDMLGDWVDGENPLSGLEDGFGEGAALDVRVEVVSGQPARILRAGSPSAVVAAGNVGSYYGGGPVAIGPISPTTDVEREGTSVPPPPVEVLASLTGHALGATGLPSVGAEVFLSWAQAETIHTGGNVTASDGSFALQIDDPCESPFAIVLARPNPSQKLLGVPVPHAVPLVRDGLATRLYQPIRFQQSAAVHGFVRDDHQLLRAGVLVVPCVVDHLFGKVLALTGQTATTDTLGSYRIQRLPANLPRHQSLVLLMLHDELEPTVLPIPERSGVAAIEEIGTAVAKRLRWVRLVGMPPNEMVTVYEEIPGLPAGSAAVRRMTTTTIFGQVFSTPVGSGRMWVRRGTPTAPLVSELVYEPGLYSSTPRYRMQAETQPLGDVFRQMSPIAGTDVSVAQTFRHQFFEVARQAASGRALLVVDSLGYPVANAEVFAVSPSAPRGALEGRFLAFSSQTGASSIATVTDDESVLVIAPDGSVGYMQNPTQLGFTVSATVRATGRVNLAPSLRPAADSLEHVVTLRFTRQDDDLLPGMPQTFVRFARAENAWEVGGLPPGTYDATASYGMVTAVGDPDETFTVVVPAGGFVVLGE